jgi:hypothetical protein
MEFKHMKTTNEELLGLIAEVNHLDTLSTALKENLPSDTAPTVVRSVDELDACIARIQEKCGTLQRTLAQEGSLPIPPDGFVARA